MLLSDDQGWRRIRVTQTTNVLVPPAVPLALPLGRTLGLPGMQMILWMIAMPHQVREPWGTR